MKILIDMNLSPSWADFLIEAGFEAVHWSKVGASDANDSDVMQWVDGRDAYPQIECIGRYLPPMLQGGNGY
jgi:predicted nuclease of predicted toxin-antitoxin system